MKECSAAREYERRLPNVDKNTPAMINGNELIEPRRSIREGLEQQAESEYNVNQPSAYDRLTVRGTLIMIGVGYDFATIISHQPPRRYVDKMSLLNLHTLHPSRFSSFRL